MAIFLKFEGVEGNATQDDHMNWTKADSFQFGVGRGINTHVGAAGNREASEPSVSEVTVTMEMDRSSTIMFQETCVGKQGKKVTIDFCRTDNPPVVYMQYTLHQALVSGYSVSSGGGRPMISVSYNFSQIEMKYTPYGTDNKAESPMLAGYDVGKGTKI